MKKFITASAIPTAIKNNAENYLELYREGKVPPANLLTKCKTWIKIELDTGYFLVFMSRGGNKWMLLTPSEYKTFCDSIAKDNRFTPEEDREMTEQNKQFLKEYRKVSHHG